MNRKILALFRSRRRAGLQLSNGCKQRDSARRPNGFTLMELLIRHGHHRHPDAHRHSYRGQLKKKANDLSAQQSIRAIHEAEIQYQSTYPTNGYACMLPALGGEPSSGAPSATGAQILQGDLTSGYKSGYIFTITCKDKVTVNSVDRYNSYLVTATPQTVGKTGDRGFCSDEAAPSSSIPLAPPTAPVAGP